MIHELLFNLWNNPGNIIDTEYSDWTHLFELPQFLHPGEEKLLQIIINIGVYYHKITSFTNDILNRNYIHQVENQDIEPPLSNIQAGLYLKAFSHGIKEVLQSYRTEILKLEDKFLEFPQLSLTYVLSCIDKYRCLFGVLKSMINKIHSENLHGCLLMNGLHKYINCGVDQIEEAAKIIIKSINTVFYQHLCNWIVCGDLIDPYNEFFICDGKVADENFLYPEQLSDDTGYLTKKNKIKRPPPVRKFYINWDMVPTFINEELAETILFMGRIVWIVRNDPKKDKCTEDYQTKFRRDIWEGKDTEYYTKVQELGNDTFNGVKFKKTIEECRVKLTKYLWSIMLEEGNLIQHLKLIRDYYALGRGELFQQFLTVSDGYLKDASLDSTMQHINFIFHETSRKIYGENDKTYLRFEIMAQNGETSKGNPFQRLQLNFEVEWPLHIIFHPEVMAFYNKLFCYLLRLKKTQINLFKLWSNHTLSKNKIDRRVWMLRQNLMFLVNNLQYYMQVNVIEAQFSILLKAVENANEFEDIIKIHHEFVTNLLAKSFVLTPEESPQGKNKHRLYQMPALQHNVPSKVYNVVTILLELCDKFCMVANTWETTLTESDLEELDFFQKRSDVAIESLLFVLYSLHEKVSGGHLLQLLLHLDFNRYFSKNRTDMNITGALNNY
ncbi:gamma-tubulin complex component 4 [Rhynchophorus ferrugineus]|uniref:gamma-tubulin complex component 4 n=1 Tax=Rhynchophorus ferrugineus TaxID=354439 RepID=UPI003FCCEC39